MTEIEIMMLLLLDAFVLPIRNLSMQLVGGGSSSLVCWFDPRASHVTLLFGTYS